MNLNNITVVLLLLSAGTILALTSPAGMFLWMIVLGLVMAYVASPKV
jgi:hypothetical protein